MKNILTVDLEDWFSVETLQDVISRNKWPELESSLIKNIDDILNLFHEKKLKATFFVLGWVADKYPAVIADVAAAGHEIACHSYYHRMVSSLTPEEFKKDTEKAVNAIVKSCGVIPSGYRSPSWGIKRDMQWAFEILGELGFEYDSSIYPIYHDIYGDPDAPRRTFEIELKSGKNIVEIPASTIKIMGARIPIGGGGWLRHFPYWFTRWGIKTINKQNMPAVVYFHPWELDDNVPRVQMSRKNKIRQYGNLKTVKTKLAKLLNDFDLQSMDDYLYELRENTKNFV
ncbi:MAG: XrtA system polysaccharide deacetylase [candidate division Zixibacteria bacterium]